METSGMVRRAFSVLGHDVISCDTLPADDGAKMGRHIQGDVFETLEHLRRLGWWPDLAIFHPTCTYHTVAAAWAFKDPDYDRYPGVGYHQRVRPGTLTGAARRAARCAAEADCERIKALPIKRKVVENPKGTLPTRTSYGSPADVLQPYEFGDDASKATCIWVFDENGNPIPFKFWRDPDLLVAPTPRKNGKSYWGNQTDTGQNNVSPDDERWKDRSKTYPGIAAAFAEHFGIMATYAPLEALYRHVLGIN